MTTKEVTKVPISKPQETSVDTFISQAISNNVPVETMEKLFALREKVKAEQAQEAYVRALSTFQSECPVIQKTKKVLNKDGVSVRYQYAPLDSITEQIRKTIAGNDLSYSWNVELISKEKSSNMKVACKLTHILGHSEVSSIEIPIAVDGFMTEPQKYASAQTYAKRYTLLNILGITTADEDTDATDVGKEAGAKSNKAKIIFLLRSLNMESKDKAKIEESIKKATGLTLEEKNYEEIVGRLEVMVKEKQEYENPNIQ